MDEILGQLGGLLLGSVPTVIFIVLLYGIYTSVVHKPLVKVLADRRSLTEGAIEKARADIAQAEARTADYEQRMREARMAIFKSQEARRQQALQARAAAVAEARRRAQAQVEQARAAIEQDKGAAQGSCRPRAEDWRLKSSASYFNLQPKLRQVASDTTIFPDCSPHRTDAGRFCFGLCAFAHECSGAVGTFFHQRRTLCRQYRR